jgi:acetylornithine deacetylase/succinyl-diaminopimelate desuccinylase-like protein
LWFAHSDTVHFLRRGIPSVNYGVGRAGVAHTTDEHIYVDDLKAATKVIALSASRLMDKGCA